MRIKSNVAKNEIFVDFERYFSTREWNIMLTPNTISAEDGKNYSITLLLLNTMLVFILSIIGIIKLEFLLLGILFGILGATYYIVSEKHRVKLICLENNVFETYTNSNLSREMLEKFISFLEKNGKITRLKPLGLFVKDIYEKLNEFYIDIWGPHLARKMLTKDIERLMKRRGVSREEAIKKLFEKCFK